MKTTVLNVRNYVLVFLFALSFNQAFSQSFTAASGKVEIGVGLGPSFFVGDLGGTSGEGRTFVKDVNLPLTKLSKGFYINVAPNEWLGFRFALNQSMLEGQDSVIKDKGGAERFRKERNLSFKSNVWEAYGAIEVYPTVFLEQFDGLLGKIRPYGVIGVGVFHFNPKAQYIDPNGNSKMVALQPLRLEGQGMEEYPDRKTYKLTQLEVPMGFGAKYYIKENMYIGMEVLHRKTFTDYIDDVSTNYIDPINFDKYLAAPEATMARQLYYKENQINPATRPQLNEQRGDPKQNDAFFSTIIRLGWRLNSNNNAATRQMRCPRFY